MIRPPPEELAAADRDEGDEGRRRLLASGSVVILYLALALYGNWVLMGVIEEKTNRVVEVLLGTLRPTHLLAGKVFGILIVAVSQLVAAALTVAVTLMLVGHAEIPAVAADVAAVSAIWFILGLVFYNLAYAAVGATVSRQADASGAAGPLIVLLLVPYMLSLTVVPDSPDGLLARILSIVPITAPLAMPPRVAMGDPALWEIGGSVLLMLPSIVGMIWLGGRIYAGAILRTGSRVGLLEALRTAGR